MTLVAADLAAARTDLAAFARILGQPLADHQAESLRLERLVTVIVAHRQAGKSDSTALLALQRAAGRRRFRVLVVSAGEEAAKRLLGQVRALAKSHPLLAVDVVDDSAGLVTLSNGSEIRSVPQSAAQIRGWSVDLLIIDEAAMVDDDLVLGSAFPTTLARSGARIVLASSPMGTRGVFYDYARRGWNGDPDVATFRWPIEKATWITPEMLKAMRAGLSPLRARAELDGEFVDIAGHHRLIDREWIDDAQARVLEEQWEGTAGLDVARFGSDSSSMYLNRGGRIRRLWTVHGLSTTAVAGRARGVLRDLPGGGAGYVRLVVDDAGVGGGVVDQLRDAGMGLVRFIGSSRASRPAMFLNRRAETFWLMREAFEAGLVDLDPGDRELAGQLGELRFEYDDRGRIVMESKSSMLSRGVPSPDAADAVSMTFAHRGWRAVRIPDPAERRRSEIEEILARVDAAQRRHAQTLSFEEWAAGRRLPAGVPAWAREPF